MDRPRFVVGIGASAGGVEALTRMMGSIDCDGAAFVVVTHLPDDYETRLDVILSRHSNLRVCPLINGLQFASDSLYVLNGSVEVRLGDHGQAWITRRMLRARVIDTFFTSLAHHLRVQAIGVVLSGLGRDGADGLSRIKAAGGHTFVQEPRSARFDAMPHAAIDFADEVLPPEEIGPAIARLVHAT